MALRNIYFGSSLASLSANRNICKWIWRSLRDGAGWVGGASVSGQRLSRPSSSVGFVRPSRLQLADSDDDRDRRRRRLVLSSVRPSASVVRPLGLLCFRADSFQGRSPSPSPFLLALSVCCPLSNQPISSGPPGFAYETKGVGNCTMQKTVSGRPKGLKINLARVFIFGLQMGLCCHRN